jgi:hypothetical protein
VVRTGGMPHTGTVDPNGRPSLGMERLGFQNCQQGRGVVRRAVRALSWLNGHNAGAGLAVVC